MIKTFLILLPLLSIETLTFDDEAFVETVYSDHEYENKVEETSSNRHEAKSSNRQGKFLYSWPQNPVIDIMLQTASQNYVPQSSGDFFDFLRDSYKLPGGLKAPLPEYDFVIVGAGSAGCALASRLTENRNVTVLLIETGKPEMILTDVPSMAPYFLSTDYVWHYYMEPQPGVCRGMQNERCFWPRGKAVGGTSVINYMIYTRGRPQDWDRIAAAGNYGWSYNEVIQFYKKSEKARLEGYEKQYHRGRDGVLPVEFVPVKTELSDSFLEAGRLLGHPTVDYNAPDNLGFGKVQVTISKGRRQSAAKVFLHDHRARRNLHVLPQTTATKVLIDPASNTAYGVEYVRNRLKYTVRVRREVILSAGPIASPQLLMLSGIGPKEHLESMGIPVVKDLPAGQTLYDHICFPGLIFRLNTTGVSFNEAEALKPKSIFAWLRSDESVLSSPGAVECIGYIKTPISRDPELVPDIELISIGGSIVADGGPGGSKAVRKGMRISDQVFKEAFGDIENTDTWSVFPMLLHPKSVGRLELKDKNPFSHPRMYGNYLTDPSDVATFVAAIRHVQSMASTEPFQKFGATVHLAQYPSCKGIVPDSDEYWECAVRSLTATLHHQVATCRMGPEGDPLAIVDPELRVYGIRGLRVVDSSVIPQTIAAHTCAPAMMIGEKAADMIKAAWNL